MRTIISERKYKAGYVIRTERIDGEDAMGSAPFEMKSCYTPTGDYMGGVKWGHRLCKKRGIKPEIADPADNVCSIGFSEDDSKWYGWSHRAINGFSIGDVVKEGDCCAEPGTIEEYLTPENDFSLPVGFEAKTLADCRRMAIAFADSVS